jgi:hypothetical protein
MMNIVFQFLPQKLSSGCTGTRKYYYYRIVILAGKDNIVACRPVDRQRLCQQNMKATMVQQQRNAVFCAVCAEMLQAGHLVQ